MERGFSGLVFSVDHVDAVVKQMKEQHAEFVAALQAREETSIEWRREPLQFTPTMIEIPEEGPRETRSGEEHNRGFSSLVLCRTFYIHSEKLYGAINGMRLGWCALDPVPQWEIRCALVELGRLIEVVSIYTRVMVNNVRVREEMEVIGEDGEFAPVETGFMKSSRQNTEFNRQMVVLFGVCAELFESKFIATSVFSPVFGIDMTKRTIDGESFAFNKKRPDGWSKAMRLLLLNFKSIQTRALERAVYDMETAK